MCIMCTNLHTMYRNAHSAENCLVVCQRKYVWPRKSQLLKLTSISCRILTECWELCDKETYRLSLLEENACLAEVVLVPSAGKMFPQTISRQDLIILITVCSVVSVLLIIIITIICVLRSRRIRANKGKLFFVFLIISFSNCISLNSWTWITI